MNPFTDESRNVVWEVGVKEWIDQLRAPAGLEWLKRDAKPAEHTVGTFVLKAALDQYLIAEILAGRYRSVTLTLVGLFGSKLTGVSEPDNRQPLASRNGAHT